MAATPIGYVYARRASVTPQELGLPEVFSIPVYDTGHPGFNGTKNPPDITTYGTTDIINVPKTIFNAGIKLGFNPYTEKEIVNCGNIYLFDGSGEPGATPLDTRAAFYSRLKYGSGSTGYYGLFQFGYKTENNFRVKPDGKPISNDWYKYPIESVIANSFANVPRRKAIHIILVAFLRYDNGYYNPLFEFVLDNGEKWYCVNGEIWFLKEWVTLYNSPEPLPPPPPPGPFEPGGDSGPGGGGGTFDDTSTPVDIPKPPSISAAQTGLISLFTPTLGQLNSLASFLWSDLFDLATWKKVFSEPMDAILGLSILPVKLPGGAVKEVTLGNVNTGVSMAAVTSQYVTVDCGVLDLEEYWKAYLDYSPYTKVEIYLPYIGIHALDTDDVMGKKLQVSYNIDVLTGACTAFVKAGDSVLYSYVGTCSVQIPVTGSNYNAMLHGVITSAAAIGTMALTGGATAPMLATTAASAAVNAVQKPTVEKSGSLSGSGGIMGIQKPYLIITRPKQAKPKNQNVYTGYPAYTTQKLGDLKGYTEVEQIHLENIPATAGELAEIETLLKGGVLL